MTPKQTLPLDNIKGTAGTNGWRQSASQPRRPMAGECHTGHNLEPWAEGFRAAGFRMIYLKTYADARNDSLKASLLPQRYNEPRSSDCRHTHTIPACKVACLMHSNTAPQDIGNCACLIARQLVSRSDLYSVVCIERVKE